MAGLNEAIQAALEGPERKDIKINTHNFNVKPVTRDEHDGELHVWGQISHKLTVRPDDQIFYHIVKKDGAILTTDINVNKGGWQKIAGPTGLRLCGIGGTLMNGHVRSVSTA
jgi:hypothetical protein